jgi:hypothetical protein
MTSQWQPIATAPKDATAILITDGETCAVAFWSDIAAQCNGGMGWRDFGDLGWGGMYDKEPTHWMPLPAVPADATP